MFCGHACSHDYTSMILRAESIKHNTSIMAKILETSNKTVNINQLIYLIKQSIYPKINYQVISEHNYVTVTIIGQFKSTAA